MDTASSQELGLLKDGIPARDGMWAERPGRSLASQCSLHPTPAPESTMLSSEGSGEGLVCTGYCISIPNREGWTPNTFHMHLIDTFQGGDVSHS